jgi:hypothetical protein
VVYSAYHHVGQLGDTGPPRPIIHSDWLAGTRWRRRSALITSAVPATRPAAAAAVTAAAAATVTVTD